MIPAIDYAPPDRRLEADGDSVQRRAQRANRAALDIVRQRNAVERAAVQTMVDRLDTLKDDLSRRLLAEDGSVTDFRRFTLNTLIGDVDRLIADTQHQLADDAKPAYTQMDQLGDVAAEDPIRAAGLTVKPGLPGLDADLIAAAFDNTVELLTQPMQQFGSAVKVLLRGVALAGDNRMDAIQRLRDQIQGQGFDSAQYKAERIIRTELGRTFNQATYDRLLALAKDFPFLRKAWRAAGDSRTRLGHRQAASVYGRGNGIPMAQTFRIQVYDERKGKDPKFVGTAALRFPLDPQATPAGRVAAGATILCRCNAFVDFDMADFAQYSASQIQLALGGVTPPIAGGPTPVDTPTPTPAAKAKPRQPAPLTDHSLQAGATEGPLVSASLIPPASGALRKLYDRVMAALDKVHSDGRLGKIPLNRGSGRYYGQYTFRRGVTATAVDIKISAAGLKVHPLNTLAHEVGHWLDTMAVGRAEGFFKFGIGAGQYASEGTSSLLMDAWKDAVRSSDTYQRLRTWAGSASSPDVLGIKFRGQATDYTGVQGDGTIPKGVNAGHLQYLLSTRETWARAYAQYVAIRSEDPALVAELRAIQAQATTGPVPADAKYNTSKTGKDANSWEYPTVWQDHEFEPIARAFDRIFESMGWRKGSGQ